MVAVRQPPQAASIERTLTGRFANLTVFDIGAIAREIRALLDQVSLAVQAVFLLTVMAGWMVLQAALLATRDERHFEAALMRALGATATQMRRALLVELSLAGGLAGLLAAVFAQVLSAVLCTQVLGFEARIHGFLLILGVLIGAGLGILGAWSALGGVLRASPMASLRTAPGA
jgi:putative ABC transport system permease protein